MCNCASFIVTKHEVEWLEDSDSHDDIIKRNGLDDGVSGGDFVRVEIVPPDFCYNLPYDQWKFVVDQDRVPEWWNAEWAEAECRNVLPALMNTRIVPEEGDFVFDRGVHIVLSGSPNITMTGGGVGTFDTSAPNITVTGGYVRTFDTSAPNITVTGGYVRTFDTSAPNITVTGGYVRTYDTSAPKITMTGGGVLRCDASAPKITDNITKTDQTI